MLTSFVVRLVLGDLSHGSLRGEVVHVATGVRLVVRSSEDLVVALQMLGMAGAQQDRDAAQAAGTVLPP